MLSYKAFFRLPVSLLLYTYLVPLSQASPSIDVSLRAAFPAPPLLVELFDTAVAEDNNAILPLLNKIAVGTFDHASSDQDLYNQFHKFLQDEKIFKDSSALSSWKLALSVHEAAPHIEAQYQFWNSTVRPIEAQIVKKGMFPAIGIFKPNMELCIDPSCSSSRVLSNRNYRTHTAPRPFDRVVGSAVKSETWTVYFDPADSNAMAQLGGWLQEFPDVPFRLRYRLPHTHMTGEEAAKPLWVSGYGVELALKRTDYIVIDDRDAEVRKDTPVENLSKTLATEEDIMDVKPLSATELLNLGLNAASFILNTETPIDTLAALSQDLPKHAASLSAYNASQNFLDEHASNREMLLPSGVNYMWINGVQINPRDVNVFALLDHLRRERRLINGLRDLGLSASDAVKLLSHSEIAGGQGVAPVQRYEFRDHIDGGKVIMWLNNIEKDRKYLEWPTDLKAILQRVYPGQLPVVRKDVHNVVFPVDLTKAKDAILVVQTLQSLVQRMLPIRFGIVPQVSSQGSADQAKVIYYLQETYGLGSVMQYLETSIEKSVLSSPSQSVFTDVTSTNQLRRERTASSLSEVLSAESSESQISKAKSYLSRLSADAEDPPFFANGASIALNEEWMQSVGQRVSLDLRVIQQLVFDGNLTETDYLPEVFLAGASLNRNPLIVPADENAVVLFDMNKLATENEVELAGLNAINTGDPLQPSVIVFLDLNKEHGCDLLINAADFALSREDINVILIHFSDSRSPQWLDKSAECLETKRPDLSADFLQKIENAIQKQTIGHGEKKSEAFSPLANAVGLEPGEQGILISGRLLGPLSPTISFTSGDFESLVSYERRKRIKPVVDALEEMGLLSLISTATDLARFSSLVALSSVLDVPEGMFDSAPGPRTTVYENWASGHTSFTIGTQDAPIDIVVSVDPVSEVAQRWVPIIKVLSGMDGVRARVFLNPKEKLQELPAKRFYRHVLEAGPLFSESGELLKPSANFLGIPQETLLTTALDTPPSWLVAPEESIYDLDNIKLSNLRGQPSITAIYELEHILIEGHSRDTTTGQPPRGVQLTLSTEITPDFAGTIIMANLGYFQFKANPGIYTLSLQDGLSKEIYNIDSAGTMGYAPQGHDETTEIGLYSFQGATIFPRLSKKPGRELDDVLEMPEIAIVKNASGVPRQIQEIIASGAHVADKVLAKVGVKDANTAAMVNKGIAYGQSLLTKFTSATQQAVTTTLNSSAKKHADINIFSVASGHLYERMLNIMMVSVMRHTNHSVKFWFIEQFLSPSFKEFLPTLADKYGFEFEMVTYKWPHWLRAQKEKQRVIWGYKILFLDVLFPLDLDKVIFVDADQIVRTDMYELVTHDLEGAPYGFTPMCDSRTEMEGFRFWKQGYWKTFLRGLPYHISALYVVDLKLFRAMAAGDRLRQQYHSLSADPNSLSNLDQDLPNHMQMSMPIHSLPQEWLWCETWCSDDSLKVAKTIDLCNNPMTKEPKLDRARRQVPEWTVYDDEIAALAKQTKDEGMEGVQSLTVAAKAVPRESVRRKDEL